MNKEYDKETGFYYFLNRYYNPQTGRFIQVDPFRGFIEFPLSQNPYLYVMGNPLKWIDPLGLAEVISSPWDPSLGMVVPEVVITASRPFIGWRARNPLFSWVFFEPYIPGIGREVKGYTTWGFAPEYGGGPAYVQGAVPGGYGGKGGPSYPSMRSLTPGYDRDAYMYWYAWRKKVPVYANHTKIHVGRIRPPSIRLFPVLSEDYGVSTISAYVPYESYIDISTYFQVYGSVWLMSITNPLFYEAALVSIIIGQRIPIPYAGWISFVVFLYGIHRVAHEEAVRVGKRYRPIYP